jgi:hypothetical protein
MQRPEATAIKFYVVVVRRRISVKISEIAAKRNTLITFFGTFHFDPSLHKYSTTLIILGKEQQVERHEAIRGGREGLFGSYLCRLGEINNTSLEVIPAGRQGRNPLYVWFFGCPSFSPRRLLLID